VLEPAYYFASMGIFTFPPDAAQKKVLPLGSTHPAAVYQQVPLLFDTDHERCEGGGGICVLDHSEVDVFGRCEFLDCNVFPGIPRSACDTIVRSMGQPSDKSLMYVAAEQVLPVELSLRGTGGAISVSMSTVTIDGPTLISRCSARYGGGLNAYEVSDIELTGGVVVEKCRAGILGGGFSFYGKASLLLRRGVVFRENFSPNSGGAV
jgi:hypothetical protein